MERNLPGVHKGALGRIRLGTTTPTREVRPTWRSAMTRKRDARSVFRKIVYAATAINCFTFVEVAAAQQLVFKSEPFPKGAPYFTANQQTIELGTYSFCAITNFVWQSRGIDQAQECQLTVDNGVWTFHAGTRLACGVTCFTVQIQH